MVSSHEDDGLIYGIKVSSVAPGQASGQDIVHEPSNMDLAMKLHYIKGIYYFDSKTIEGVSSIKQIKAAMFNWLDHFYITSGRFRRSETGRPYIKCNDSGARFIEARCEKRLDEWLEMKDIATLEKLLVSSNHIGPDLAFSPLVYMQFTRFKCGGVSMGLSMAHVLGDAFSASEFFNFLGKVMTGHKLSIPINIPQSLPKDQKISSPRNVKDDLVSVKQVSPVGDNWIFVNDSKMEAFSFHVTPINLSHMQSKASVSDKNADTFSPFESLCAVLWQYIAKVRQGDEPKVVTIIQKGSTDNANGVLGNNQAISNVKADFTIHDQASLSKLATMIKNHTMAERKKIEDAMEREEGSADLCVYGANLTFVNYEDADFYGCEIMGKKPMKVSYWIDGVGDNGAVFVLPGPYDASIQGSYGRIVTVILPKEEVMELILELKREWSIV